MRTRLILATLTLTLTLAVPGSAQISLRQTADAYTGSTTILVVQGATPNGGLMLGVSATFNDHRCRSSADSTWGRRPWCCR